jgi:WD40 repeat protein
MALYDAFISYSHAKDKRIAEALQSVVQRLGKPWYRRRALRVFRDDTSLSATPHLWPSIETALGESRYLIVLASPEAAASQWVNREVAHWLEHKSINTLLIAVTDGELAWDNAAGDFARPRRMPLPPVLARRFPTEPKWVDLRAYRDGADPRDTRFTELAADFAATIHGTPKEDLLSQEVIQQRRALRLAWSVATTLVVLITFAGWQWWEAYRAQKVALAAEQAATEQKGIAETQRDRAVAAEQVATEQKNEAQAQRDRALLTQSRFLADGAGQRLRRGEASVAMLLALEALPDEGSGIVRPYAPSAEAALFTARRHPREVAVLAGHAGDVVSAAFSPDGRLIVTASNDNTARIWDRATGRTIHILADHSDRVKSATFSHDGRRVVTSSDDKTARIWDAETGEVLTVLKGHERTVSRAQFSPDDRRIVTASYDGTARIWDAVTGKVVRVLVEPAIGQTNMMVGSAVFSPDGSTVTTIAEGAGHTVRVWSPDTGKMITLVDFLRAPRTFEFSPDGQRVLISGPSDKISVLDFKTGRPVYTLPAQDRSFNAAFGSGGKVVVITYRDGTTRVWNLETGQTMAVLAAHSDVVNDAHISPDGSYVVTASSDRTARVWAIDLDKPAGFLETSAIRVAFSPDGLSLATVSGKSAQIWNVKSRQQTMELVGHTDRVSSGKFSADGMRLLTGSMDRTARIWDIASGKAITVLPLHADGVNDASFSPDGTRVVTASRDGTARIWDAATGRMILVLAYHGSSRLSDDVHTAVFSPDGARVLTGSADGSARIWDAKLGKMVTVLSGHKGVVSSAVFSPNGRLVVTTEEAEFVNQLLDRTGESTARVWDAQTGKMLFVLRGHANSITGATFGADGRRLLTGSEDKTVRIWDTATWETIAVLAERGEPAISPDGRLLAGSGSKVTLWKVFPTTQELVDDAKQSVGRCLTRVERDAAFLPPEPPAWCIEMAKWPYQSQVWKGWLKAKRENAGTPLLESKN